MLPQKPREGDVWRERDSRFVRDVTVTRVPPLPWGATDRVEIVSDKGRRTSVRCDVFVRRFRLLHARGPA